MVKITNLASFLGASWHKLNINFTYAGVKYDDCFLFMRSM